MSRTIKDKPYHVLEKDAPKSRAQSCHDHTRLHSTRIVHRPVKDAAGKTVTETRTVINVYSSYAYKNLHGVETLRELPLLPPNIAPSTHGKKAWRQTVGGCREIDELLLDRYEQYVSHVRPEFYNGDTLIFVREEVTQPVIEHVEEPYYSHSECTIDVEPSAENRWGWLLPCFYSPVVPGPNSPYQRHRKHREARRNRHTAKAQTRALIRDLNTTGLEEDTAEDVYVVDYVLRKRWDWD